MGEARLFHVSHERKHRLQHRPRSNIVWAQSTPVITTTFSTECLVVQALDVSFVDGGGDALELRNSMGALM